MPTCLLAGAAWVFPVRAARTIGTLLAAGLFNIVSGLTNLLSGGIAAETSGG